MKYAEYARRKLDEYGLTETENILNEWNPGTPYRGTVKDASNICANMLALQNTSLDMLMYYDCNVASDFCGLFDPITKKPFPAYYIFGFYDVLYKAGTQVYAEVDDNPFVRVVAARGNEGGAVLLCNNTDLEHELCFEGIERVKSAYRISGSDGRYPFTLAEINLSRYFCSPYECILILF